MGQRVSVRAMARLRGCTHGAVQKAISDGRIPADLVERDEASRRIKSIDYEAATAAWNATTDVDQAGRTIGGAATVAGAGRGATGDLLVEPTQADTKREAATGAHEVRVAGARGKELQNRLLELELLEQTGALVDVVELQQIAQRRYRAIRDQILTVADRVADVLAAENDAARVHAVLTKELERALNELADDAAAESSALAPVAAEERVAA